MILSQNLSPKVVLTVAGFDPSSGAGITADLKTIAAHGCYGVAAITALTVQNTQGVSAVEPVRTKAIVESIQRLADDFEIAAVKVGMLGNGEIASGVADILGSLKLPNLIVDPVMCSSSGVELLDSSGREVLRARLLPLARVVTPNAAEAAMLTGKQIRGLDSMEEPACEILRMGAEAVVITGGDLDRADDLLVLRESGERYETLRLSAEKLRSQATHGTGCAFSTAIACGLAQGKSVMEAVRRAKEYVRGAIERAAPLGKGKGPMHHLWTLGPVQ